MVSVSGGSGQYKKKISAWGNFIKRFYKKLNSGEDISFGMTEGIQ